MWTKTSLDLDIYRLSQSMKCCYSLWVPPYYDSVGSVHLSPAGPSGPDNNSLFLLCALCVAVKAWLCQLQHMFPDSVTAAGNIQHIHIMSMDMNTSSFMCVVSVMQQLCVNPALRRSHNALGLCMTCDCGLFYNFIILWNYVQVYVWRPMYRKSVDSRGWTLCVLSLTNPAG